MRTRMRCLSNGEIQYRISLEDGRNAWAYKSKYFEIFYYQDPDDMIWREAKGFSMNVL